jgi:hypothetical protein
MSYEQAVIRFNSSHSPNARAEQFELISGAARMPEMAKISPAHGNSLPAERIAGNCPSVSGTENAMDR